jgi:hypothetical protein
MSILDALKTFKQERESIDDVAALPQALIMQMAQKGQIPKTDLPMILARKAEIAQTQAQMNALRQQQTQGAQPTLMEKMIAANAQQEAPQEMTDVGIASNPVPEMRMAGGGIVAFARGDLVEEMTEEERAEYIRNNPALQRSMGISEGVKGFFAPLAEGKNWDPVRKTHEIVNDYVMKPWQRFITEPTNIQADKFRGDKPYSYQATPEDKAKAREATILKQTKDRGLQTADSPLDYDMYDPKKVVRPTAKTDTTPVAKKEDVTAATTQAKAPKEKILGDYEKMLMDEREAAKGAREEAKYMRLMEAGLNIMGGESPYAFANIGKGAAAAAKGYASDVKGLREEERDRVKQLASIGAKREELGLKEREIGAMEKYRSDWARLEESKINQLRQQNIDAKISGDVEKNFATLMNFYKADIDKGDINPSDLYQQAQRNVGSTRGKDIGGAGNLPTANTLSWDQLNKKGK